MDRTLNATTCASCGRRTLVECPVALLDVTRKQWLVSYPERDEVHWCDLAQLLRRSFLLSMGLHAPEFWRQQMHLWQVRLLFGYEAMREKLVIAEAGLDDVAVERRKPMLLCSSPQRSFARIYLDEARGDALVWRVVRSQGEELLVTAGELEHLPVAPEARMPAVELTIDPFVSYRRWFVALAPVGPTGTRFEPAGPASQ